MRPGIELLDNHTIERAVCEAFELLHVRGVKVHAPEALEALGSSGARIEYSGTGGVAHIPQRVVERALASVPHEFRLYDGDGRICVHYGGNDVHYDPGSSCVYIEEGRKQRAAQAGDLARLVKAVEMLPQYAAQSTAMVCGDVAAEIGDLYRLFVVLLHSRKPVVTGAFTVAGGERMLELLAIAAGGQQQLRRQPRAVFDVCPSPPLTWSEFAGKNLMALARAGVPAEIVSMPLAGAAAPVTLAGCVVQHAAECLSGITLHQATNPGAPLVWGGAPAIFDMRTGTTAMGAVETAMINVACAQVGKRLGLPTHAYLMGSDAKTLDAQAGMEAGMAAVLGALAGINMISGAGMLDSLASMSLEKLVLDAEGIGYAQRLLAGIEAGGKALATEMFAAAGQEGNFLKLRETRQLFRREQYLPSAALDRESRQSWQDAGSQDAFGRAHARVNELLAAYERPAMAEEMERELENFMDGEARRAGMGGLPRLEGFSVQKETVAAAGAAGGSVKKKVEP